MIFARWWPAVAMLVFVEGLSASTVCAQTAMERFSYFAPGVLTHSSDIGAKDRRIYFPNLGFPLRVGPEAGLDAAPVHAFANSQVYLPVGFETNDARAYLYPWVDTLCESKHVGGSMPLCPNQHHSGHQGVDIRPNAPKKEFYDVVAAEDGIVTDVTAFTRVKIRSATNDGRACEYEHLNPVFVRVSQRVKKGEVIGKVSNIMGGQPGTSIHLHFQCEATHPELGIKVKVPIYASLVAAYRRAWGLSDSTENGVLLRDPERESGGTTSTGPSEADPSCGEPLSEPLLATKDLKLVATYSHNCSQVGLVVDGANIKIVYLRPKLSLSAAAQRQPVFVSGTTSAKGFEGEAVSYNKACGDPKFRVNGALDPASTSIVLEGQRNVLDATCNSSELKSEQLQFTKLAVSAPPPDQTQPQTANELTCPFALLPGQRPAVVEGKEIPPKSERSCNFTAITVPGNSSFQEMPRYIREWPGIRKELLIDAFDDQILTFQSAETGVGAWWYWLTHRAVNDSNMDKSGFGATGRPTLEQIARAIAGKDRSESYVRTVYLLPYLSFSSEYFGRTLSGDEAIDLRSRDARWGLARTMFRLESGRAPVVTRKQFECGTQLGSDVGADFDQAGVETGATRPVSFTTFKGLQYYSKDCSGGAVASQPSEQKPPSTQNVDNVTSMLAEIKQQLALAELTIAKLRREKEELQGRLQKSVVVGGTKKASGRYAPLW
jgi:hypothetical protein